MSCVCGCGQETSVITANNRTLGQVRGERRKYVKGHSNKGQRNGMAKIPYMSLYKLFLNSSRKRNINVELSFEEFVVFTNVEKCHYCEEPVAWSKHNPGPNKGSTRYNLDRKDANKGYTAENLVACCKRCNYGKRELFTYEEWVVMTAALKPWRVAAGAAAGL